MRRFRYIIAAVVFSFLLGLVGLVLRELVDANRQIGEEVSDDLVWSLWRVEIEALKLQNALTAVAATDPSAAATTPAAPDGAFAGEMLAAAVDYMFTQKNSEALSRYGGVADTLARLRTLLADGEVEFVRALQGDAATARRLLPAVRALGDELHVEQSQLYTPRNRESLERRERVYALNLRVGFLLAAVLLVGIATVAMLLFEMRAQDRLLRENRAMNDALRRHRDTLQAEIEAQTAELRQEKERTDQRRQYFEAIMRNAPVGILTVWPDGHLTDANPAFCAFVGYTAEEIARLNLMDLTLPDERTATMERLRQLEAGGTDQLRFEKAYPTRDGGQRWAEVLTAPVRDASGKVVRVASVVVDIEERRAAEAAIRSLFEASNDPYFYVEDGRYILCNAAAARVYGYDDPKDMIGLTPADLAAPVQEDGLPFEPADVANLPRGRSISFTRLARRRDGKTFPIAVSVIPLDVMGRKQTINIVHDLTQERQVQDALRRAAEAAEEATRTKSAFLATMSHEIRTPMNGIVGTLELLEQTELNVEQIESIGTIRDSAHALLTVIDDILDFSKIEAGHLRIESVPADIGLLVESTTKLFVRTADGKELTLRCFVDPALAGAFLTDPVRLRQVLSNLISNAVKFTGQGGVTVVAEAGAPREGGATLRLRVIDTGIGISPEAQQRLFQPFMQADDSTTRKFGGTGLGLSICRRLIELMGGTIAVESRPGAGTAMVVSLPLLPAPAAAPAAEEPGGRGLRIALVAADELERDFLCRWLAAWGAEALCFAGAAELAGDERRSTWHAVVAAPEAMEAVRALAAGLRDDVRFVAYRPEERPPDIEPGGDMVVASSLTRLGLITGVAIAVGRKSPEVRVAAWADDGLVVRPAPTREEAIRQGRLVLLAEDHPVNRSVITRQLRRLGFASDAVDDGTAALAALAAGEHGLLLTDCNMPEMDGFALTAALRAQELGTGRHLPIVALTANAMRGEADRCLAAGMDDYLAKPVSMKMLHACLEKWLPAAPAAAAEEIALEMQPAARPVAVSEVIDAAVLREVVGDDPGIIAETLRDYLSSLEEDLADLRKVIAARNGAGVSEVAHRMKGAARIVGAMILAEACAAVEKAGSVGAWNAVGGGAATIEKAAANVRTVITAHAVEVKTAAA